MTHSEAVCSTNAPLGSAGGPGHPRCTKTFAPESLWTFRESAPLGTMDLSEAFARLLPTRWTISQGRLAFHNARRMHLKEFTVALD